MTNMYPWTSGTSGKTWNPLAGECPHKCTYCYVENSKNRLPAHMAKYSGKPRLHDRAMKESLGKQKTIFVCSCNDLFADGVSNEIIIEVLKRCRQYPNNQYLFQTKNPERLRDFTEHYPHDSIFGITLETNRTNTCSKAPFQLKRANDFVRFIEEVFEPDGTWKFMVSIEPVMAFDYDTFSTWINTIAPDFVSIGADSKNNGLKEPSYDDIKSLIALIDGDIEVKLKGNISRLYEDK